MQQACSIVLGFTCLLIVYLLHWILNCKSCMCNCEYGKTPYVLIILMNKNFIVDLHTSVFKIKSEAKWTLHCLAILEHQYKCIQIGTNFMYFTQYIMSCNNIIILQLVFAEQRSQLVCKQLFLKLHSHTLQHSFGVHQCEFSIREH